MLTHVSHTDADFICTDDNTVGKLVGYIVESLVGKTSFRIFPDFYFWLSGRHFFWRAFDNRLCFDRLFLGQFQGWGILSVDGLEEGNLLGGADGQKLIEILQLVKLLCKPFRLGFLYSMSIFRNLRVSPPEEV